MADSNGTDLAWVSDPDPTSLRRAVRHAMRSRRPSLRIVAEGFLAAQTAIDLLGVSEDGELVSVRIAEADDSARALTLLLSDLTWLAARAEDLQKLAPDLDLAAGAPPVGILLSREFDPETHLAIIQLPQQRVQTIRYQSYRQRAQIRVQLWPDATSPNRTETTAPERAAASRQAAGTASGVAHRLAAAATQVDPPVSPAQAATADLAPTTGFRTGLTDADLRLDSADDTHRADEISRSSDTLTP